MYLSKLRQRAEQAVRRESRRAIHAKVRSLLDGRPLPIGGEVPRPPA